MSTSIKTAPHAANAIHEDTLTEVLTATSNDGDGAASHTVPAADQAIAAAAAVADTAQALLGSRRQPGAKAEARRSIAPEDRQGWLTPKALVDRVLYALGIDQFDQDMASPGPGKSNIPALTYHVEEPGKPMGGGLAAPWKGEVLWLNPPYADPYPWCQRAAEAVERGDAGLVIALVPVRPYAAWHRDNVSGRAHVILLDHRVRFEVVPGVPGGAPTFSTQLILWGGTREQVEALRREFDASDFRPAPTWWGEAATPRTTGTARSRVATTGRAVRGGGARARAQ